MSKIKKLNIKNFLGLEELGIDCSKINLIQGPKGSGKSSITEAIEKAFTNKNRRTEVIRHGKEEATIFIELDNGLEVDRRIRSEKADYLKCRKENGPVPSTEKFLRSLINGDIFRPLDWVNMSIEKQTKSILSMLEIGWSMQDIESWFGEVPSNIDFDQHILQILKSIELKYYKDREEVNRKIHELKIQIKNIIDELPAEYDGEKWRELKIQEYYKAVTDAQNINNWIEEARKLQESFEEKVKTIEANAENEKSRIKLKFREQRQDIKDIIELSKNRIEKSKTALENADKNLELALKKSENTHKEECQKIDLELQDELKVLEEEYMKKVADTENKHTAKKNQLDYNLDESKEALKNLNISTKESEKDNISIQENKISAKNQELLSLDDLEKQEIKNVDDRKESEIDKEKTRVGKASEYIETHELVEVEPLQKVADEVAEMQSYLRQWDSMINIRDGEVATKERYSAELTEKIRKARELPSDLLKTANMPIEGISVDSDGLIRINNTLIDGLSDGEKLELAMKIAKAQAGELKVICLDKFESLNPAAQKKLIEEMKNDEYQYFVTSTMSDEFKIEKIDQED